MKLNIYNMIYREKIVLSFLKDSCLSLKIDVKQKAGNNPHPEGNGVSLESWGPIEKLGTYRLTSSSGKKLEFKGNARIA